MGDGIFRSTNKGLTWSRAGLDSIEINILALNKEGNLFAGTNKSLYISKNDGVNWSQLSLLNTFINTITFTKASDIIVGTKNSGIYKSTSGGLSWTQVNNGLKENNILSLIINNDGKLFAATEGGIYSSSNNGENWILLNTGLNHTYIYTLTINKEGYVFAGTNGGGVYRSYKTTTNYEKEIPSDFILFQNYPNPFNPSTTIKFALPERAKVNLSIYNLLGEKVAELVDGELEAGYHETKWNAGGFASGVYFYTLVVSPIEPLQAGKSFDKLRTGFVETKKLILMK